MVGSFRRNDPLQRRSRLPITAHSRLNLRATRRSAPTFCPLFSHLPPPRLRASAWAPNPERLPKPPGSCEQM